eukprot:m.828832 g.828832  ORF g.828832 m.828832 type:complete len:1642 (-) comp23422_c0_seq4:134-5059(-)
MRLFCAVIFGFAVLQDAIVLAQCPNNNALEGSAAGIDVSGYAVNSTQSISSIQGGSYRVLTGLVSGHFYEISTCSENYLFDTQLTVYSSSGSVVSYNDDVGSGVQGCADRRMSTVSFESDGSDVRVLIDKYYCGSISTASPVTVRYIGEDVGCQSHTVCAADEYCDTEGYCFDCLACGSAFDAFDGVCPVKCGYTLNFEVGNILPNATEPATIGIFRDVVVSPSEIFSSFVSDSIPGVVYDASTATNFPNVMSPRLHDKLTILAQTVQSNVRFNQYGASIRVLSAYMIGDPATVTSSSAHRFHFEGRALTMRLSCTLNQTACDDVVVLGDLARLGFAAGLDWVWFKDNMTVYASVKTDGCTSPVDLVFLLDGSGSIEDPSSGGGFGFFANKELEFARNVTSFFTVGSLRNESRVGAVVFASGATIEFDLDDYLTTDAVKAALADIDYPSGATYTSTGLSTVRTGLFEQGTARGVRPDADGIPRVVIVVTDGVSTGGYAPITEAGLLHDMGITIFAIGVGNGVNVAQLNDMGTDPDSDHVFWIKSYNSIYRIVETITHQTCESSAQLRCGGAATDVTLTQGRFKDIEISDHHSDLLTITVQASDGNVHVFSSFEELKPGPYRNNQSVIGSSSTKVLYVSLAGLADSTPVYISVQAVSTSATFTVSLGCDNATIPPTTMAPSTQAPSTTSPTTASPTTEAPTTAVPTTTGPTTGAPTTIAPTTIMPTTAAPTTTMPTTAVPTTTAPTTAMPTTAVPTTAAPTSAMPTTAVPSTAVPTTGIPTTAAPTTGAPTTAVPTTFMPTTTSPTTAVPTTSSPSTLQPTSTAPTSAAPSMEMPPPSEQATRVPTGVPTTLAPITSTPTTSAPVSSTPTSSAPTFPNGSVCLTCGDIGSPGDPPTDPPSTSAPTVLAGSPTQTPVQSPIADGFMAPSAAPSKGVDGGPSLGVFNLNAVFTVKENDTVGTFVFDVGATYTGPNNVAFNMVEGSGLRKRRAGDVLPFKIDPVTGVITVSGALDFETQPTYGIIISADGPSGVVASASTSIEVEGVPCPKGLTSATGTYPCQSLAAAQEQGEDDGGGSNNAAVAGGVSAGLLCLLFLLFLLGGFLFRHRREHLMDEKEYATSADMENPLRANAMAGVHTTLSAQQVWNIDGFHRVAVFDKFYYGNEFLMSSDEQFLDVFRDLQLVAPGPQSMSAYRKDTSIFLDKPVGMEDQSLLTEAVDFLEKAWPDILVEFMIDRIAMEQLNKGYEDMIFTDYMCPSDNPFLERQHDLNRPFVAALGDAVYSFSSPNDGAIYSQASGHASEYAVANGADTNADGELYAMASNGAAGEDLYQMASGGMDTRNADTDDIYTVASHGEEQTYQMAGAQSRPYGEDDNIYSVAAGHVDTDCVYDNTAVGDAHGKVFNLMEVGSEAIYSSASSSDVVLTLEGADDRIYDTGTDNACDFSASSERLYDTGADETTGAAETCIDMSPTYDMGESRPLVSGNVILPVVYDAGSADVCAHEEPSIILEKNSSIADYASSNTAQSLPPTMQNDPRLEEDDQGNNHGSDGYLPNEEYPTSTCSSSGTSMHGQSVTPMAADTATEDDDVSTIMKDGYVVCEGQSHDLVREDSFVEINSGSSRLKSVIRKNPLFATDEIIEDESV